MRALLLQGQASTDQLYLRVYLRFHVLQAHGGHGGSLGLALALALLLPGPQ